MNFEPHYFGFVLVLLLVVDTWKTKTKTTRIGIYGLYKNQKYFINY